MKQATLPADARLSINRCNLPAIILGSLTFQQSPAPLLIDGALELHREFFRSLQCVPDAATRAVHFMDYMRASFLLDNLDDAGFEQGRERLRRDKANYLRLLRGWMFDSDGTEGAVLKHWVESRFGLMPRSHQGPLRDYSSHLFDRYVSAYTQGLYNTNALEAQIDLLYCYCQYELQRQHPQHTHWTLYRGVNQLGAHEILRQDVDGGRLMLLNNLNSFTDDRGHADAFGDYVFSTRVPLVKLLFYPGLLPGLLRGEGEYLVIGGVYQVYPVTGPHIA